MKKIQPLARGSLRMQSDNRLVKLFRRGVDPAFDELVRRYRASLVHFAAAIAGRDRADDVVQDALVKAHRSLGKDQPIEFKPWLYTVVRNTALNEIRDNQKHVHDGLAEAAGRVEQPHEAFERREELAAVVAAVSELPDSQREALVGHELGGFTHEEIAQQMKLSTGATKQLIYRARLTLRNAVGALIPFPLIAWLVSDATGVFVAGATGGAAAGGALSAVSGGVSAGGAAAGGAGGVLAGIAGTSAAKVAVVAVIAGGSVAAGLAVDGRKSGVPEPPAAAAATTSGSASPGPGKAQLLAGISEGRDESASGSSSGGSGRGKGGQPGSGRANGHSGESDHGLQKAEKAHSGHDDGADDLDRGEDRPGPGRDDDGHSEGGGRQGAEREDHDDGDRSPAATEPGEGGSSGSHEKPERPEAPEVEEAEAPELEHGDESSGGDKSSGESHSDSVHP